MSELSELFDEAFKRPLTQAERNAVAAELEAPTGSVDPHRLLLTLEHRGVVEAYLDRRDDPKLVSTALEVLCDDWGLTADYVDDLSEIDPAVVAAAHERVRGSNSRP